MELIDSGPPDLVVLGRQPRIEQCLDVMRAAHLLAHVASDELELPAPVRVAAGDVGGEPRGIANLHRRDGQIGIRPLRDVHDEPVLVVAQALPLRPDHASHETRGAVAADEVTSLELLLARLCPAAQRHSVFSLLDMCDFEAVSHLDVSAGGDLLAQGLLEFGLIEEGEIAPAVGAHGWNLHPEQSLAPGVGEADLFLRATRLHQLFDVPGQAEPLERAHRLAVESDRARNAQDLGLPLEDHDTEPGVGQLQRGHGADRPIANDGDVVGISHSELSSEAGRGGPSSIHSTTRAWSSTT